jgi:hypothetical protein
VERYLITCRLKRRIAALNLCALIGRNLSRQDGSWVLAT